MRLSASSAHAQASSVICYGSSTLDLIQEHTHTPRPWEERWSREEWTMLPQLARVLTLPQPHFIPLLLSLSASPTDEISPCADSSSGCSSENCCSYMLPCCVSLSPSPLLSLCDGSEELSGVSASPVQAGQRRDSTHVHSSARQRTRNIQICIRTGESATISISSFQHSPGLV